MSKVSLKGVFWGGVVDVVTTNILSLPVVFYVMAHLRMPHASGGQMQAAVLSAIHSNPLVFGIAATIGVGCSVLGGYVAARIAKRNAGLNGALSAWLCIAIGIYSLAVGAHAGAIGLKLVDFVVSPLAGLAGGYLYGRGKAVAASEA